MSPSDELHPNAISVKDCGFLDNSYEVARLWVEDGGPATCVIRPDTLVTPEIFGMLMVDTVRHAGRAFAQYLGLTETEALGRIWAGPDAERNYPTTGIRTLQDFEPDTDDKQSKP